MDFPELGDVSLSEIEQLRGPFGLPVERDLHFRADKTITRNATELNVAGHPSQSLGVNRQSSGIKSRVHVFSSNTPPSPKYMLPAIDIPIGEHTFAPG